MEDPTGHALDAFYRELARTDRKAHAVTASPLRDSVITSDLVSGTLRRRFQERFGDAGHGFILTANPWEWYHHNDVTHAASDGWSMSRITGPFSGDHIYGLGGVSFHAKGPASASFGTANKGDYGRRVSRFDVYYLEQPGGGDVDVVVSGPGDRSSRTERLSTRGPKKTSRVFSRQVPDGGAELTLRTRGSGDVRVFGVALERDVPGVAYDALGVNGARARLWEQMDGGHWRDQMDLRRPALVILQYGTNESEGGRVHSESYERQLGALIDKIKGATPNASILVAAPMDRAEKEAGGGLRTAKAIVQLVELQRKVAHERQVAFFDTFEAMGGPGTFARWVKETPQLASWDLTHPRRQALRRSATSCTTRSCAGTRRGDGRTDRQRPTVRRRHDSAASLRGARDAWRFGSRWRGAGGVVGAQELASQRLPELHVPFATEVDEVAPRAGPRLRGPGHHRAGAAHRVELTEERAPDLSRDLALRLDDGEETSRGAPCTRRLDGAIGRPEQEARGLGDRAGDPVEYLHELLLVGGHGLLVTGLVGSVRQNHQGRIAVAKLLGECASSTATFPARAPLMPSAS